MQYTKLNPKCFSIITAWCESKGLVEVFLIKLLLLVKVIARGAQNKIHLTKDSFYERGYIMGCP